MARKSGLGSGYDALFPENSIDESNAESSGKTMIKLSKIEPNPNQPRKTFKSEELSELAASIAENGLIQPIVVRPSENDGYYTIIAGERRWRACKRAAMSEIPVIIMNVDNKKAAELALIENIQREDLDPIEEARAYRSLIDEYGLTQSELADKIGKSRTNVANMMRLLELPDEIIDMVTQKKLSAGHARALLGLKDPSEMHSLAERAAEAELSVRQTEDAVRKLNSRKPDEGEKEVSPNELRIKQYYKAIEDKATQSIGSKVKISDTPRNKTVTVEFSSNDELEEILVKLCGKSIFDDIK